MFHLKIGDQAPDWIGQNERDEQMSAQQFKGKKYVVYFYPKDNTPGCTTQSCNLRDNYSQLTKEGIEIVGVSGDAIKSHLKFIDKYSLPFRLIADEDRTMMNLFGVWGEKKFMGKVYDGIHRTTFLINENGLIADIIRKPKTKFHSEEILESFKEKLAT
jgi:peroxiredoxin Q/BCP